MAVVGDATVKFHGDVSSLDKDVENAVKRLKNKKINLEAELDMSNAFKKIRDLRYRNKSNPVSIPIVADDKAFQKSLNKIRRSTKDFEIGVSVDDSSLSKSIKTVSKGLPEQEVKLGVHRTSFRKALDEVIDSLDKVDVDVKASSKSVKDMSKNLYKEIDSVSIPVKFDNNTLGKESSSLNKKLSKGIGKVSAEVVPVTKDSEALAMRTKLQKLYSKIVSKVDFTLDDDSLLKEATELKVRMDSLFSKGVPVNVRLKENWLDELSDIEGSLRGIQNTQEIRIPVRPTVDDSEFLIAKDAINKAFNKIKANIDVEVDGEDLRKEVYELMTEIRSMGKTGIPVDPQMSDEFYTRLYAIKERIESVNADIQARVETDKKSLALAEAELKALERKRTIEIDADVSKFFSKINRGLTEALTGVVPPRVVADSIEDIVGNLSKLSTMSSIVVPAIGAVSGVLLNTAGSATVMVKELATLTSLGALTAPALGSIGLSVWATMDAFNGFKKAIDGNVEAIGKLPPNAREAVYALQEFKNTVSNGVQNVFWEEAETSIARMVRTVLPNFNSALRDTGQVMGNTFKNASEAVDLFANNGGLSEFLSNTVRGIEGINKNTGTLTQGLLNVSLVGSRAFSELGSKIGDVAGKFGDFLTKTSESGQMADWLSQAFKTLTDIGSIVGNVSGGISAIGKSAERAGIDGFGALSLGAEKFNQALSSMKGQNALVDIFRGANEASESLFNGIGRLLGALSSSSGELSKILSISGSIAGISFDNLGKMVNYSSALDGLVLMLEKVENGARKLEPSFVAVGNIVGGLAPIFGTIFEAMVPGMNRIMETASVITTNLSPAIQDTIPFLNAMIELLTVIPTEALKGLSDIFASLPSPIQTAVVAMAGIGLAGAKIAPLIGILSTIGAKLTEVNVKAGTLSGSVGAWSMVLGSSLGKTKKDLDSVSGSAGKTSKSIADMTPVVLSTGSSFGLLEKASSVGSKALTGVLSAGKGLLSLMGGPLGLAITGASMAVSWFSSSNRQAEDSLEQLSSAVSAYGNNSQEAFSKATDAIKYSDGAFGKIANWVPGLTSVSESFDKLGWNIEDVAKKTVQAGGEWTSSRKQIDELIKAAETHGRVSEEQSNAILGTSKAAGMTKSELQNMANALDEVASASDNGKSKIIEFSDSMQRSLDHFSRIADASRTLSDQYSTLSSKQSAFKTLMEQYQDTASRTASANADFYSSMDNFNQSFDTATAKMHEAGQALFDYQGNLDTTGSSASQLYQVLEGQADKIFELGVATYDNAIKNGDSVQVASDKAVQAMSGPMESLRQKLVDSGAVSVEQVDTVMDALGLIPDEVKTVLTAEDRASQVAIATERLLRGVSSQKWETVLTATEKDALGNIANAIGKGEEWANGEYNAVLEAIADEAGTNIDGLIVKLGEYSGKDHQAYLSLLGSENATEQAENFYQTLDIVDGKIAGAKVDVDDANAYNRLNDFVGKFDEINGKSGSAYLDIAGGSREKLESIRSGLEGIASEQWKATLSADPGQLDFYLDRADLDLNSFEREVVANLSADNQLAVLAIAEAKALGDNFSKEEFKNNLSLNYNVPEEDIDGLIAKLEQNFGKDWNTTLSAEDNASIVAMLAQSELNSVTDQTYEAWLDANASDLGINVDKAKAKLGELDGKKTTSEINGVDNLTTKANSAKDSLDTIVPYKNTDLVANDGVSAIASLAKLSVDSVPSSKHTDLTATDNASLASGIVASAIFGIPSSRNTDLSATDNTYPGVSSAQTTMGSLPDVSRGLSARDEALPGKLSAQGTMNGLLDVSRGLSARDEALPGKLSAQGTMNGLLDVSRGLSARDEAYPGKKSAQDTINSLQGKTVDARANAIGLGDVEQLKGSISGLVGKTVDVVTRFFNQQMNADGGINLPGQMYADGGIVQNIDVRRVFRNAGNTHLVPNVEAFAGGGIKENRIAQIAKPTPTYRIWAEPETGGEAYIPLSEKKRARSLNILRQVADMFGYELMKASKTQNKRTSSRGGAFLNGGLDGFVEKQYNSTRNMGATPSSKISNSSNGIVNNVTINPSVGMDEKRVGDSAVRALTYAYLTGGLG